MQEIQGGVRSRIARMGSIISSVAVDTSASDCDELPAINFSGGSVSIPSGSSVTSLTMYGCHSSGGTFLPVYDIDGAAVVITVAAGRIYSLPAEVFDIPYMKLVSNASGTISVFLKG